MLHDLRENFDREKTIGWELYQDTEEDLSPCRDNLLPYIE
jgi:hypothetical protein